MWGSDKRAIVDLGKRAEQVLVFLCNKTVLFGKVSKAALFAKSRCVRMSPRCEAGEAKCAKCLFLDFGNRLDNIASHTLAETCVNCRNT
jgi:hypothetical protein